VRPFSPAQTPIPRRAANADVTAIERENPSGWPAMPTVPHVAPSRSRLTPAKTIRTVPDATCVRRQK
jgi:hypothetical protein